MRNASGHQGENEWQRKKGNRNTYKISPIKLVTRKFLAEFNVVVVQNNGKKKMYEKVCFTCKVVVVVFFFCWLDQLISFGCFRCLRRLSLNDFIFCLSKLLTIDINESFTFSPSLIYILFFHSIWDFDFYLSFVETSKSLNKEVWQASFALQLLTLSPLAKKPCLV